MAWVLKLRKNTCKNFAKYDVPKQLCFMQKIVWKIFTCNGGGENKPERVYHNE